MIVAAQKKQQNSGWSIKALRARCVSLSSLFKSLAVKTTPTTCFASNERAAFDERRTLSSMRPSSAWHVHAQS